MPTRPTAARIQKLMALARDQQGTPEGEAAARMARRMMLQQAKAQAEARYQGLPEADPVRRHRLPLGGHERWRRRLATSVARHVGCVAAWPRGEDVAFLFGHGSAIEVGTYLFEVLSREVAEAIQHWIAHEAPLLSAEEAAADPEDDKRRGGFGQSAVTAIDARLHALREREAGRDPTGTALILDRRHEVDAWLEEQGVDLVSPAQRPWRHSPEGYLAGYRVPLLDAVTRGPDGPSADATPGGSPAASPPEPQRPPIEEPSPEWSRQPPRRPGPR